MARELDAVQHLRILQLFESAVSLPLTQRSAFLDQACGEDGLREKIRALLEADRKAEAGGFLAARRPDETLDREPIGDDEVAPPRSAELTELGPYLLHESLGRGGMGLVRRATHRETGAQAAVKTVVVPRQAMLDGLRREIRSLARLHHPGIVRILDEGLHEGLPWYAMELLEGTPLSRYWSQERRPSVDEVLRLVHDLCAPLGYLHGEGLVHCDLKPQNILVRAASGQLRAASGTSSPEASGLQFAGPALTADSSRLTPRNSELTAPPQPVLIDFGLLATFTGEIHRDVLELESHGAGTPAYMAPEQIRGESCDARVDLYALGCILFELLTGHHVFETRNHTEMLAAHLFRDPPVPSQYVEGLPAALDDLVLRLLAKNRRERIGHADDVAAILEGLGVPPETVAAPAGRPYLYRPGFSGRDRELEQLADYLRAAAGHVIFVGGESGIGKTRLALELAREATRQRVHVFTGEALPPEQRGGGLGLELLRQPLQRLADRCRERGAGEIARVFGAHLRLLSSYEPTLRGLPGHEAAPEPDELPPADSRRRLFKALAEVLDAAAQDEPLLLILDDLQWADELTLAFVESLLREPGADGRLGMTERRWLLLGLYRTEEASATLRAMVSTPPAARFELGRLQPAAVSSMVAEMLGLAVAPPLFSRFVDRHSEGNPFFVAEYLRIALEEGVLWRDSQGVWQVAEPGGRARAADYEALPLPRSLREVVRRRLDGLPATALYLVELAAVLGRETEVPLLRRLALLEETEVDAALQELLRRQVLEEPRPGSLRFLHDKLREGAYDRIEPARRGGLHRAAAEGLENLGTGEARAAELAHHWEQAGETGRSRPYYRTAARQAAERYSHQEAERLYRAHLRLTHQPDAQSVAVRNELAEKVLVPQGRTEEAREEHQRALSESRQVGDIGLEGESLCQLGALCWPTGRTDETRALYEEALGLLRRAGDRKREAVVLDQLAMLCHHQGRTDESQQLYGEALSISRETGDRRREARVLGNLGNLYRDLGRSDDARRSYDEALSVSRKTGDRLREAMVLGYVGFLHHFQGRLEEAWRCFEESLRLSRETGSRMSEAIALGYLARVRADQNEPAKAQDLYEQALAKFREIGDARNEGIVLQNLADQYFQQGRLDEARSLHEQGLERFRQFGQRRHEGIALSTLGAVCKDLGQVEDARRYCEQALSVYRESAGQQFEGIALTTMAELEWFVSANIPRAKELVDTAERIYSTVGANLLRCGLLCIKGHIALAEGENADGLLREAEALADEARSAVEIEVARALRGLARTIEAVKRGENERIFRGRLLDDLPDGLRNWALRERQANEADDGRGIGAG